jgi:hypothetical protein
VRGQVPYRIASELSVRGGPIYNEKELCSIRIIFCSIFTSSYVDNREQYPHALFGENITSHLVKLKFPFTNNSLLMYAYVIIYLLYILYTDIDE